MNTYTDNKKSDFVTALEQGHWADAARIASQHALCEKLTSEQIHQWFKDNGEEKCAAYNIGRVDATTAAARQANRVLLDPLATAIGVHDASAFPRRYGLQDAARARVEHRCHTHSSGMQAPPPQHIQLEAEDPGDHMQQQATASCSHPVYHTPVSAALRPAQPTTNLPGPSLADTINARLDTWAQRHAAPHNTPAPAPKRRRHAATPPSPSSSSDT